jgi:phage gp45-like
MEPTIPHYLASRDTSAAMGPRDFFNDVSIYVGEVTDIIQRDDPKSHSRKFTEYVVLVWRRKSNGPQERLMYRCTQADSFGGIGDLLRFSYRSSTSNPLQNAPQSGTGSRNSLTNGAAVLVACINGDRSNAVIIGGIPHPSRRELDPPSSDGDRYLRSKFNGVEMAIADDGSFELKVPGPTDTDGKPDNRDSNNHGSKVTFAANGSISIDDQNGDIVTVDPGSKSISIESGTKLSESSQTVEVNADLSWKLTAPTVTVISPNVNIGAMGLTPPVNGVVLGRGIDTLTGLPYSTLGNSSLTVKANV